MDKSEAILKALAQRDGAHIGDFLVYTLWGRHSYSDAIARRDGLGLTGDITSLRPVRANKAYRRAVNNVETGEVDNRRWATDVTVDDDNWMVHQLSGKEIVDSDASAFTDKAIKYSHEVTIKFDKRAYARNQPPESLLVAQDESHPLVIKVRSSYLRNIDMLKSEDLKSASTKAFQSWHGVRFRRGGGVWLFPADSAGKVRAWQEWASAYGEALVVPIYDSSEGIDRMKTAVANTVEGALKRLNEEFEAFADRIGDGDDTLRTSTVQKRVEELDALRQQTEIYERILQLNINNLGERLKDAEQRFVEMVSITAE